MISPLKSDKGKIQWYVPKNKKLRAPPIKKTWKNTMHTFFYYNISEFAGNLEGILDEGKYRTIVQSTHKLGWKVQYFKSADVSMLGHGCDVSQ